MNIKNDRNEGDIGMMVMKVTTEMTVMTVMERKTVNDDDRNGSDDGDSEMITDYNSGI